MRATSVEVVMDFQFRRYDHGQDNISIAVLAVFTSEEFQALTQTGALYQPCIDKINPTMGFWRGEVSIHRPTFLQLVDPGLLFQYFTGFYAQEFQNDFEYWYGSTIRGRLAPVLQHFVYHVHRDLEYQRDSYFGAAPQIPYHGPRYYLPRR